MKKCVKKQKKMKVNKRREQETKPEHVQTKWVLCSEDWRDVVIMHVPDFNNMPIEENYAEISQEIKDAFLINGKRRKPHKKKKKKRVK